MLHDLCVELLQEIAIKVGHSDHKSLRSVCKDINLALGPLFFSSFVLTSNRLRLDESAPILKAVANGQNGWSYYTKTLIIRPGRQPSLEEELTADACIPSLNRLLSVAVGAMQNIRTVRWQIDDRHPPWALNSICEVLHTLPLLTDLQLSWWPTGIASHDLPLTKLSGLRKLTISSRYRNPNLGADQVSRLVHQNRGLTSLYLLGGESAGWSEVWRMLRLQRDLESPAPPIHLIDICTDMMTADLLEYSTSYSGLKRLQYRRSYGGSREAADALADIFYDTVLPCHADSLVCLRDLDALTNTGTRWGFGHHNVDTISRLQKLEILEMCVNAADVLNVEPPNNAVVRATSSLLYFAILNKDTMIVRISCYRLLQACPRSDF
ncbi:hypothetical protein C8R43DRAFT_1049989 [Mycena crocata]|nr:hypothetical protein C8R43DRAFT_1049989 [Mycena crocata]